MGKGKPGKGGVTKAKGRVVLKGSSAPLWSTAFRVAKTSNSNDRGQEV